ncbi:MAG: hypothetical protein HFG31_00080 [Eubacterium sp.]|nr:hypothetical protein [Eubacterium sp.]
MSKIIDITDKLSFEENPKIKIKDVELEVDASAENLLKVMAHVTDNPSVSDVMEMCELIFTKESKKDLDALKLNFTDYANVVMAAIGLASGNSEEENSGE